MMRRCRLRLVSQELGLVALLSAMTVRHGDLGEAGLVLVLVLQLSATRHQLP